MTEVACSTPCWQAVSPACPLQWCKLALEPRALNSPLLVWLEWMTSEPPLDLSFPTREMGGKYTVISGS